MPVSASLVTRAILAAGPDLTGPSWVDIASVVGVAVVSWLSNPAHLVVQGAVVGLGGSGVVTGTMRVPPTPITVPATMVGAGITGIKATAVGRAIGVGVATAFTTYSLYQGVSVGVGAGTDVSRVVFADGSALVTALGVAAVSMGITGVNIPRLCAGTGPGIALLLSSGVGVGVVAGAAGPIAATGTSISKVF